MNYKFDPCFNLTIEEYFEEIIRLKKLLEVPMCYQYIKTTSSSMTYE